MDHQIFTVNHRLATATLEDEFERYFLGLNEIRLDLLQNLFRLSAKNVLDDIQIKFLELK